jgi:FAD/FMN-containing dehydrogenase
MPDAAYAPWGLFPPSRHTALVTPSRAGVIEWPAGVARNWLPRGNGRSYGDVCLNDGGGLIDTTRLDRFLEFDAATGRLSCEPGLQLGELIRHVLPHHWFPAVTPGTQFVTVAGAVANDVHGKNHHVAGCFGNHVTGLEVLRSDGQRLECSPTDNAGLFNATIGGLGLTGLITRVDLQLRAVPGSWILQENIPFGSVREFLALSNESESTHDFVVAWVDCLAPASEAGRGVFFRGNHTDGPTGPVKAGRRIRVPFTPPFSLVGGPVIRAFNMAYRSLSSRHRRPRRIHLGPFFYPLDGVLEWNRIYGRRGFQQYQCVIPPPDEEAALTAMLNAISKARTGSFLAVLKRFGAIRSPGLCSFPRLGSTLALDFPVRGSATDRLFDELDGIVSEAGGILYPAKDGHVARPRRPELFPDFRSLVPYLDPALSSGFWRRQGIA